MPEVLQGMGNRSYATPLAFCCMHSNEVMPVAFLIRPPERHIHHTFLPLCHNECRHNGKCHYRLLQTVLNKPRVIVMRMSTLYHLHDSMIATGKRICGCVNRVRVLYNDSLPKSD